MLSCTGIWGPPNASCKYDTARALARVHRGRLWAAGCSAYHSLLGMDLRFRPPYGCRLLLRKRGTVARVMSEDREVRHHSRADHRIELTRARQITCLPVCRAHGATLDLLRRRGTSVTAFPFA